MAEVITMLEETIADFDIRIEKKEDDTFKRHEQKVARLEKRLEDLKALEVKQWDEKTKGGMPGHVFAKLNEQTVKEMEEVSQALEIAKRTAPQAIDYQERVTTFRAALELLRDPDAPAKEQNRLLKLCIESIIYSRPHIKTGPGKKPPFHLDFTLRV
jgi:TolA-binding protein